MITIEHVCCEPEISTAESVCSAAISKTVGQALRSKATARMSFAPCRSAMLEARAEKFDRLRRVYYSICERLRRQGASVVWAKFQNYPDLGKLSFMYVPTTNYLQQMYISHHFEEHREAQDAYQQSIFGKYWSVDHSFKVTKRITLNGQKLFLCLFTITNEHSQIVKQTLCTSKGKDELRRMLLELKERYEQSKRVT